MSNSFFALSLGAISSLNSIVTSNFASFGNSTTYVISSSKIAYFETFGSRILVNEFFLNM